MFRPVYCPAHMPKRVDNTRLYDILIMMMFWTHKIKCVKNKTEWWRSKLTTRSTDLPEKLAVSQMVKKSAAFLNHKFRYRVHKRLPLVRILRQIIPINNPSYFLKIRFNIIFPSTTRSSKWYLSLRFPYQNPVCTYSSQNACHRHQSSWYPMLY